AAGDALHAGHAQRRTWLRQRRAVRHRGPAPAGLRRAAEVPLLMKQLPVTEVRQWASAAAAEGEPLLLDVREPWEVQLAAIRIPEAGTLNLPMGQIPQRLAELDPAQPILCICHHGMRSAQV